MIRSKRQRIIPRRTIERFRGKAALQARPIWSFSAVVMWNTMFAMALEIIQAVSAEEIATARRLIEEYVASLSVDLSFQDFAHEVSTLSSEYSPPRGRLLLAIDAGAAIGCGALRPFDSEICEMKRLYVIPASRRTGAGLQLAQELIRAARAIGYRAMRLDTLPGMEKAQELYRSLGFREIAAYRYNPIEGTRFLELNLLDGNSTEEAWQRKIPKRNS